MSDPLSAPLAERDPAEWNGPSNMPGEFAEYAAPVPQLAVGQPGKVGILDLRFEDRTGKTRLTRAFGRAPLHAQRALYLDPALPGMAFVQIISTGGGILQGDRLKIRVDAGSGTQVHVTTQAATKVYRMEHDFAVQIMDLRVGPDAFVEWLPDPLIPYRHARFYQEVDLHVNPTGQLLYWDVLLPGREGERFQYDILYNRVQVHVPERKIFSDTFSLQPGKRALTSPGLFGEFSVLGSFYAVTTSVPAKKLAQELHEGTATQGTLLGTSVLPGDTGVVVRVLGHYSDSVMQTLHAIWRRTRQLLLGCSVPVLRKY